MCLHCSRYSRKYDWLTLTSTQFQTGSQRSNHTLIQLICQLGICMHGGRLLICSGHMKGNTIPYRMNRFLHYEICLAVNAGSGKPAGICQIGVAYAHRNLVVNRAKPDKIGDIIADLRIAVRTLSDVVAVAPYSAIFIDSIKYDSHALSLICLRQ